MSSHNLPVLGLSAHIAISHIVHLGGIATYQQIAPHLAPRHRSRGYFESNVIRPLLDIGLITRDGRYSFLATQKGSDYACAFSSQPLPSHEVYVGQSAPVRTHNPRRELDVAKHRAVAPFRPGSDDHLRIPSLMGSTRKLPNGEVVE